MVRRLIGIAVMAALSLAVVQMVTAQNLLDNPEMRQSREYERLAAEALEEGDYEDAIEYSELAADYARRGQETAERMALGFRANSMRNRADSRLYYARRIGVPSRDQEAYDRAAAAYEDAVAYLNDEEYQQSINKSQEVLDILADFQPRRFVAERPEAHEPAGDKPRYYIVRLIPERRDSFWRIAEYDFIYGDPWLWPRLYERNKHMLHDPDNPHLIHPGMMFEIPSRNGEERAGIWNPQDAIE